MEPVITKFDNNSLQIEKDPVVVVEVLSLEEIEAQLTHCLNSKSILEGHIAYYQGLKDKATEFTLKTKEQLKVEEVIIEESIPIK